MLSIQIDTKSLGLVICQQFNNIKLSFFASHMKSLEYCERSELRLFEFSRQKSHIRNVLLNWDIQEKGGKFKRFNFSTVDYARFARKYWIKRLFELFSTTVQKRDALASVHGLKCALRCCLNCSFSCCLRNLLWIGGNGIIALVRIAWALNSIDHMNKEPACTRDQGSCF